MLIVLCAVALGKGFGAGVGNYISKSPAWFASPEAGVIASNVLTYQSALGGWPKNVNDGAAAYTGKARDLEPTFDNGATTTEMRFLARAFSATKNPVYAAAFHRGWDYLLKAQYTNGGWPQKFPPGKSYARHITFNDESMVRIMRLLKEAVTAPHFAFLEAEQKEAARAAFERGVGCILKCQVRTAGRLTAWCAQHDEKDFSPRPARAYELVSLSGAESVEIVRLLMGIESPSAEVTNAVISAVSWFESAKIPGIKVLRVPDERSPKGTDKRVIKDPAARPMWARFYEIGSNRPMFCDRDGVPKFDLAEIGYERRNGYGWLDYWPERLLAVEFPAWREKHCR